MHKTKDNLAKEKSDATMIYSETINTFHDGYSICLVIKSDIIDDYQIK